MRDPYDILGVSRSANADDVKKAYRALAKKYHPDLNPGDKAVEQKFKDATAAYELLSDPTKRARYDRGEIDASGQERAAGFNWRQRAEAGAGTRRGGFGGFSAEDIFADLFGGEDVAGFGRTGRGAGRAGSRLRGADVSYSVSVSFLDAATGARKQITLPGGKTLEVQIPVGAEDGQTLRLKGQGQPGVGGGSPGDALIELRIEPHPYFTRKGLDIHVDLPVTLQEAALGATVQTPTIHGPVSLKVPAGSNSGTTLRLRGKGVADAKRSLKGDQYVRLRVMMPDPPDPELIAFLERWSPGHGYDVRRKAGME